MEDIVVTICFNNITAKMIKKWVDKETDDIVEGKSEDTMYYDPKYDKARKLLILDLIQYNLHISHSKIKIDSVRSAEKISSKLLLVQAPANFGWYLFIRAADVEDNKVCVMQFTPG